MKRVYGLVLLVTAVAVISGNKCEDGKSTNECLSRVKIDFASGSFVLNEKIRSDFYFVGDTDCLEVECCKDPCASSPCVKGKCQLKKDELKFECDCHKDYYGERCEIHENCKNCHNASYCDIDGACTCKEGYTGDGYDCTAFCMGDSFEESCDLKLGPDLTFERSYANYTAFSTQKCETGTSEVREDRPLASVLCHTHNDGSVAFTKLSITCTPCNISLNDYEGEDLGNVKASEVPAHLDKLKLLTKNVHTKDDTELAVDTLEKLAQAMSGTKKVDKRTLRDVMVIIENLAEDLAAYTKGVTRKNIEGQIVKSHGDSRKAQRKSTSRLLAVLDKFARAFDLKENNEETVVSGNITVVIRDKKDSSYPSIKLQPHGFVETKKNFPVKTQALEVYFPSATVEEMSKLASKSGPLRIVLCLSQDARILTSDVRIGQLVHISFLPDEGIEPIWIKNQQNFKIIYSRPKNTTKKQDSLVDGKLLEIKRKYFCVYYDKRINDWSREGCWLEKEDTDSPTCICNHFSSFALLLRATVEHQVYALEIHSIIASALSATCLLLNAIIYLSVGELRKRRPTPVLVNICFSLFTGFLMFVIGMDGVYKDFSDTACFFSAAVMHVAFLAAWFWTLIYSLDMYYAFVKTLSGPPTMRIRVLMYLVGYGMPILIVGSNLIASIFIDSREEDMHAEDFKSVYVNNHICWVHSLSMYIGFTLPVGLVLATNFVLFALIIQRLRNRDIKSTRAAASIQQQILTSLVLVFTMGLTWIFGYIMLLSEDEIFQDIFAYTFDVFNSLQGVALFLASCVKQEAARDAWINAIKNLFIGKKKTMKKRDIIDFSSTQKNETRDTLVSTSM